MAYDPGVLLKVHVRVEGPPRSGKTKLIDLLGTVAFRVGEDILDADVEFTHEEIHTKGKGK